MITQVPQAAATMAGPACAAGSDEEQVVLRDGSAIVIRPLAAGDVATVAAWFEGLGPEARYPRFIAGGTTLDDRMHWQLAPVDHRNHKARQR